MDCSTLKNRVSVECEKVEEKLMNTWFPKVIHLVTSKNTLQRIRGNKLDAFYNCVSTLISNQVSLGSHEKCCCSFSTDET